MTEHRDAGEAFGWVYRPEAVLATELLILQAQCTVEAAHPHRLYGFATDCPSSGLVSRRSFEEWLQHVEVLSTKYNSLTRQMSRGELGTAHLHGDQEQILAEEVHRVKEAQYVSAQLQVVLASRRVEAQEACIISVDRCGASTWSGF